jgi:transcriptional regulator with XRE-family HTH domain
MALENRAREGDGTRAETGRVGEMSAGEPGHRITRPPLASASEQHGTDRSESEPSKQRLFLQNRVRDIAIHVSWYGFKTQVRIAQDSGVSPAAVSRLIRGESQPSLAIALRLVSALSRRLNRPLDVSEVFSLDGTYPTPSACELTGCRACLPPEFYDSGENLKPQYRGVEAGNWSVPAVRKGGE